VRSILLADKPLTSIKSRALIFLRKFLKGKTDRKTYKKIKVGEKEYFKEDIVDSLKNTNFHIIEKIINKGEQKW